MYFNNLPLRVKITFFFIVATILSFSVHYAAIFTTENEYVFLTMGIIMSIFSIALIVINLIAYIKER
jgi:hypothetical protein